MAYRILVADDEADIARLLQDCRPLINRLYGNNFLHVLQAFQLFLFGHLQSPTNGLLYQTMPSPYQL